MAAIKNSEALKKDAMRLGRHWQDHSDKVRLWFRDVVRQDNEYLNYLDRKNPSLDDQKKFINHLLKKVILGKTVINDFYEEEVLRWAEDKGFKTDVLDSSEGEEADGMRAAVEGPAGERLRRVRATYDPDGIFAVAATAP